MKYVATVACINKIEGDIKWVKEMNLFLSKNQKDL